MSIGLACHATTLCGCVLFPFVSADNGIEATSEHGHAHVRLQSAAAGGTMELLLGGTAQRCRGEVQRARSDKQLELFVQGCGKPMMSRARSRTRRYSGGQRQKHAKSRV